MVAAPNALLWEVGDLLHVGGCSISPSPVCLQFRYHPWLYPFCPVTHAMILQNPPSFTLKKHCPTPPIALRLCCRNIHTFNLSQLDYCNRCPAMPWPGSSMCKTQLPALSHTPSPGSTSPLPHPLQLAPCYVPHSPPHVSVPSCPRPPSTWWTFFTNTYCIILDLVFLWYWSALHPLYQAIDLQWQSL